MIGTLFTQPVFVSGIFRSPRTMRTVVVLHGRVLAWCNSEVPREGLNLWIERVCLDIGRGAWVRVLIGMMTVRDPVRLAGEILVPLRRA